MKTCMVSILAALSATALFGGTTLTWVGKGSTAAIADAANWDPEQLPASGDTLKFTSNTTIGYVGCDAVDVGEDGLTLEVASGATLTTLCRFKGEGSVTKAGAGMVYVNHKSKDYDWSHTGGTIINEGELKVETGVSGSPLGSSAITINRSEGKYPLFHYRYGMSWVPTIYIKGTYQEGKPSIQGNNLPTLTRPIYAEDSFGFAIDYGPTTISGGIYAPGKTMYVHRFDYSPVNTLTLNCECDCSLDVGSYFAGDKTSYYLNDLTFGSNYRLYDQTAKITIHKIKQQGTATTGKVVFIDGAVCYGSLITEADCGTVEVNGPVFTTGHSNFNLAEATTFTIASGVTLKAKTFTKGGITYADKSSFTDFGGTIATDANPAALPVRCRVAENGIADWKDPADWYGQVAPYSGCRVLFPKVCSIDGYNDGTTAFTLNDGETLTIENDYNVSCSVKFTGKGSLAKEGTGILFIRNGREGLTSYDENVADKDKDGNRTQGNKKNGQNYMSDYTGGTYIRNGQINSHCGENMSAYALVSATGNGTTYIVRDAAKGINPTFRHRVGPYGGYRKWVIQGEDVGGKSSILWNNSVSAFKTEFEAEADFVFQLDYGTVCFTGDVNAHGHTMTVARPGYTMNDPYFANIVDASIVIGFTDDGSNGIRDVKFKDGFVLVDPNSSITITKAQTTTIEQGAKIYGSFTNNGVPSTATGNTLTISGSDVFAGNAPLAIKTTEGFAVGSGKEVKVSGFSIDGVAQEDGEITTYGGKIIVDSENVPSVFVWTGAAESAKGGQTTRNWHTAGNWMGEVVPSGSNPIAVFPRYVWELVSQDENAADVALDISNGMTFDVVNATNIVNTFIKFTGSGSLTKVGKGRLSVGRQDDTAHLKAPLFQPLPIALFPNYTGNTYVKDGVFYSVTADGTTRFTPGAEIWIQRTATCQPKYYHRAGISAYPKIHITGSYQSGSPSLDINTSVPKLTDIWAEDDFEVLCQWGEPQLGNIHAAGKTVYLYGVGGHLARGGVFNGEIDCNLVLGKSNLVAGRFIFDNGFKAGAGCSIELKKATNVCFRAGAKFNGSYTVDSNAGCITEVKARNCLGYDSTVSIASGSTFLVDENVKSHVKELTLGGTKLANGTYNKTSEGYAEYLTGDGSVVVGSTPGGTFMYLQ